MEPLSLVESRRLLSQEGVRSAVLPSLTFDECLQFDEAFGTNYCSHFRLTHPKYSKFIPSLHPIIAQLLNNAQLVTFDPGYMASGHQTFASVHKLEGSVDNIQEISGSFFRLENGEVYRISYRTVGGVYRQTQLIPFPEPISKIFRLYAIGKSGRVYYMEIDEIGTVSFELINTPYLVRNITVNPSGNSALHSYPNYSFYLGINGEYGRFRFPEAIKAVLSENSALIGFLTDNGTVEFYGMENLNQTRYFDDRGDLVDLGLLGSRLIGLTNSGQLVQWNRQYERENFPIPKQVGKIISMGYNLVLDSFGTLYSVQMAHLGYSWVILTHQYEIGLVPNLYFEFNWHSFYATGKPLATGDFRPGREHQVSNVKVLTTDLYGNQLVQYQYATDSGSETRKSWIHPKTNSRNPININGNTIIIEYTMADKTNITQKLDNSSDIGVLYKPGDLNPQDPEINIFYVYAGGPEVPWGTPESHVGLILARSRNGSILPVDATN